jgi:hypothetical protein
MDSEVLPNLAEVPYLLDLEIESFDLDERSLDLDLYFRQGYRLRCFCAEVHFTPEKAPRAEAIESRETRAQMNGKVRNNWSFWSPSGAVVIGPSGEIAHNDEPPLENMRRRLREIIDVGADEPD